MKPTAVDDFLLPEDLDRCRKYCIEKGRQMLVTDQALTDHIWKTYVGKLREINPEWIGLYTDVTITNSTRPTPLHQDQQRNAARQKILIYLNDVENGGTVFYTEGGEILVENKINRLVCFDIELHHKGQDGHVGRKLAIGFRPIRSEESK